MRRESERERERARERERERASKKNHFIEPFSYDLFCFSLFGTVRPAVVAYLGLVFGLLSLEGQVFHTRPCINTPHQAAIRMACPPLSASTHNNPSCKEFPVLEYQDSCLPSQCMGSQCTHLLLMECQLECQ